MTARRRTAKQRAILAALRQGCTRSAAAEAVGISRATFYRWLEEPAFERDVVQAEAQAVSAMVAAIWKAAETDWRAAAWWLERRYPEDWASNRHLKHGAGRGGLVRLLLPEEEREQARLIESMTDEQLIRLLGASGGVS